MESQKCLEIEIIDDSIPENWVEFTLLFSTNNSKVDLITHEVNVLILISANHGNILAT